MPLRSDFWSFLPRIAFGLAAAGEADVNGGAEATLAGFGFVVGVGAGGARADEDVFMRFGGLFFACSRAATALISVISVKVGNADCRAIR